MNKRYKKMWIKALRSGKYKKGTHQLFYKEEDQKLYCCLGVLKATVDKVEKPKGNLLSKKYLKKYGLSDEQQRFLAERNDGEWVGGETGEMVASENPWSFNRIANWIEKNL